jgi:hypothetical protein
MNVKFRKAAVTDWEQLCPLLEGMGLVRDREKSQILFEDYVSRVHHCIVIAENNQDLLGYAWRKVTGRILEPVTLQQGSMIYSYCRITVNRGLQRGC